jgi:hypothetical protein
VHSGFFPHVTHHVACKGLFYSFEAVADPLSINADLAFKTGSVFRFHGSKRNIPKNTKIDFDH